MGRVRPRQRGERLARPLALVRDGQTVWQEATARLYRAERTVRYAECQGQWYRACGTRLLKIVVVPVSTGSQEVQVFFCTDAQAPAREVLERYASRWGIEVSFRDLEQHLGFAESSARTPRAVQRTAPFVGLLYTLVVLWYVEHGHRSRHDVWPCRPWYRDKRHASFEDMLWALRRALAAQPIADLACHINNLQNTTAPPEDGHRKAA